MKIEWSKGAYKDYDEILDYIIKEFGLNPARIFKKKLLENISILSEQPFAGKIEFINTETQTQYRSLSCKQYRIIYTLMGDRLIIMSFWNNKKNPVTLNQRLKQNKQ